MQTLLQHADSATTYPLIGLEIETNGFILRATVATDNALDWLIAHPLVLYTGIVAIALVALWFLHRATKEG